MIKFYDLDEQKLWRDAVLVALQDFEDETAIEVADRVIEAYQERRNRDA
jgi:hypothetical protein